ncbi:hypothetical protein [Symbiobacterium thermophilum]|uniref:hypothetical protein n=1 Tax=Symbiobacterium thermophilum TaxID=2734 RepID=UPI0035C719E4
MDGPYLERPDTRAEQYLVGALLAAVCLAAGWLVVRIRSTPGAAHPLEFTGLFLLLALAAYLGHAGYELSTVRYALRDQRFRVAQGRRAVELDLRQPLRLHRWLNRWDGSGAAAAELGVAEVEWYPPVALVRTACWVVVGHDPAGLCRAVAVRPSPHLLALLREMAVPKWGEEVGETADR